MALPLEENNWAFDLSKNILSTVELMDEDVINQSIELILSTMYGERIYNPSFGSPLMGQLFEGFTNAKGEQMINDIIEAIERWEDRIVLDQSNIKFIYTESQNSLEIFIPYYILSKQILSSFHKKISFQ